MQLIVVKSSPCPHGTVLPGSSARFLSISTVPIPPFLGAVETFRCGRGWGKLTWPSPWGIEVLNEKSRELMKKSTSLWLENILQPVARAKTTPFPCCFTMLPRRCSNSSASLCPLLQCQRRNCARKAQGQSWGGPRATWFSIHFRVP